MDSLRAAAKTFLEEQVSNLPDPEFLAWAVKKNIKSEEAINKLYMLVSNTYPDIDGTIKEIDPTVRLQAAKVSYNLSTDTGDSDGPTDAEIKILEETRNVR